MEPLPTETLKLISFFESKLRIRFDLKRQPWKRAVHNAILGNGLIIGISKTSERQKYLDFSEIISLDRA